MNDNVHKITFEAYGSTLQACNNAANDIARGAFGTDDFHISCDGHRPDYQTIANEVLVWRGSYTAYVEDRP